MIARFLPLSILMTFAVTGLWTSNARAAACCGGGFALPSLITGDDQSQLTGSISQSQIDTDVYQNGVWRKRNNEDRTQIFKLDTASIFFEDWQIGLALPLVRRSRSLSSADEASSAGLGDVSATIGYEYLPEWDYSRWRPKGIGFVQLTAPTGKSLDDTDLSSAWQSRGRGFWTLGLGNYFAKSFGRWDTNLIFDVHRSFAKDASSNLKPGYGSNIAIGGGLNLRDLRIGASLTWAFEDAVASELDSGSGSPQRFATGSLSASYMLADSNSISVSYSDQTLFGDPSNTSLSKSISLAFQKRWPR